ncbi:hypothetical protein NP603_08415 [Methylomonas sp. SURF-1]|uniref:Uncharacterized protein n=1 Tax=Methylomonas aurea TaxID=2952224 RepID=A0ABT1UHE1_9GAMM|nr:hypothetical protein [Methylomonas sp. SURF-1]MCQ8181129.1 hypothetical protein [Methylomonas sp. SURF-1]
MAVNTKIVDRLIQELIKEKSPLPFRHYVYDENTGVRYEVIVNKVAQKPLQFNESRLSKSMTYDAVLGPKGQPCGCCNGSGKS